MPSPSNPRRPPLRPILVPTPLVDARPWDAPTAAELRRRARRLLNPSPHDRHLDDPAVDDSERDTCAACALDGWRELPHDGDPEPALRQPNHSGWARLYVQAGRPVPIRWRPALLAQFDPGSGDPDCAAALGRDFATWGANYCDE